MRKWEVVFQDVPEEDIVPSSDPQDWEVALVLRDDGAVTPIHEMIYVTFTGTIDADDNVVPTPAEQVDARIEAMLDGLNKAAK